MMFRITCVVLALLLSHRPALHSQIIPFELEAEVNDCVGEFFANRDSGTKKGHAFAATGEWYYVKKGRVHHHPFNYLRIDRKGFDYQGFCVLPDPAAFKPFVRFEQTWAEFTRADGKTTAWEGGVSEFEKLRVPDEDTSSAELRASLDIGWVEPFNHIIAPADMWRSRHRSNLFPRDLFLKRGRLIDAKRLSSTLITATREFIHGDVHWEVTIKFDNSQGSMPTHIVYEDFAKITQGDFHGETFVLWQERGKRWFPVKVNAACNKSPLFDTKGSPLQNYIKFDWLIDDEIEPEMLEPVRLYRFQTFEKLLGKKFDRLEDGKFIPGELYKRPEHLMMPWALKTFEAMHGVTPPELDY